MIHLNDVPMIGPNREGMAPPGLMKWLRRHVPALQKAKDPIVGVIDWVSEYIRLSTAVPWTYRAFPGKKLARISWPTGFYPAAKVQPNKLFYYPGAMRWSFCHLLCMATDMEQVRAAAFGDGTGNSPIALRFDEVDDRDAVVGSVETSLYLLPPTKLIGVDREMDETLEEMDGLYLLSLVDERFWWQTIPMPVYEIGDETNWSTLLGHCATALGVTIAGMVDDATYLMPDKQLNLQYEVVPPVLDAVLYNVGLRLIRELNGEYKAMDAATSAARHAANLMAAAEQRIAGGARFQEVL